MEKNRKKTEISQTLFLLISIPILLIIMVVSYLILNKIAKTNSRVCKYIGNLWVSEMATETNPNPRNGCYTYQEFYK
ncbi:hypothetical protein A2Z22_01145 [Candidatus Woesebacteria bacterium RBG_16_34_12]|uniref:Uncharacterized protein n=1 Tax=Candidatus Woesebacteria bacterium RBG_16_34_12 TaxID=1802480 RepID=A0A1F7X8K8_9BACT|nr:MAG: hypothetical protein A2Z22_01145 [Candidatus Woesebacteria bacterium RBG_16_34_12]